MATGADPEGERGAAAGDRGQDGPSEVAGAEEAGEAFLGGLAAVVDEGRELGGRGDIGAVEDAQGCPVTVGEEPRVHDGPRGRRRRGSEGTDHGCVGSRVAAVAIEHETPGSDGVPGTRAAAPIPAGREALE